MNRGVNKFTIEICIVVDRDEMVSQRIKVKVVFDWKGDGVIWPEASRP